MVPLFEIAQNYQGRLTADERLEKFRQVVQRIVEVSWDRRVIASISDLQRTYKQAMAHPDQPRDMAFSVYVSSTHWGMTSEIYHNAAEAILTLMGWKIGIGKPKEGEG